MIFHDSGIPVNRKVTDGESSQKRKVRRAQLLLKADADGPNWTDERIAESCSCRTRTVENFDNGSSSKDLKRHSIELNERNRPWRNC
jgi:hypothetical protein